MTVTSFGPRMETRRQGIRPRICFRASRNVAQLLCHLNDVAHLVSRYADGLHVREEEIFDFLSPDALFRGRQRLGIIEAADTQFGNQLAKFGILDQPLAECAADPRHQVIGDRKRGILDQDFQLIDRRICRPAARPRPRLDDQLAELEQRVGRRIREPTNPGRSPGSAGVAVAV
jgi:hypothetical protein